MSENNSGYDYKNFRIQNSIESGLWYIVNLNTQEVLGSFSTDRDAEKFIDNMNIKNLILNTELDAHENEDNNLPVKSTTLKNLSRKYKNCTGIAYILSSEYNGKYATTSGIGNINDPSLIIFKSAESARQSRLHRNSSFGIEEVELNNGNIKF